MFDRLLSYYRVSGLVWRGLELALQTASYTSYRHNELNPAERIYSVYVFK